MTIIIDKEGSLTAAGKFIVGLVIVLGGGAGFFSFQSRQGVLNVQADTVRLATLESDVDKLERATDNLSRSVNELTTSVSAFMVSIRSVDLALRDNRVLIQKTQDDVGSVKETMGELKGIIRGLY